jgi:formylglycine-generating enzyme required for sulfatase activity
MLSGYERVDTMVVVAADRQTRLPVLRLQRSRGAALIKSQPAGAAFELRNGEQVVQSGVTPASISDLFTGDYELLLRIEGRELREPLSIKSGETTFKELEFAFGKVAVTSQPPGAEISVDGRTEGFAPIQLTLAEGKHDIAARYRKWPEQRRSVVAESAKQTEATFEFLPGTVKISSSPAGATIVAGGEEIGRTPHAIEDVEPGEVRYELRLNGYEPTEVSGLVAPGAQIFLAAHFVQHAGPQRGRPWENSLRMKFVPVGDVLMAVWPTRNCDYEAFCQATGKARQVPDFPQDTMHPVVKVSWEDATAFCEWLTKKELDAELLEEGQQYRLPLDAEWSLAAGLPHEGGATPEERDGKFRDFPWGKQWPPPADAGNYADSTLRRTGAPTIAGYHDGFAQTSPVGSFAANRLGLYDMGGNVWQWCLDGYKGSGRFKDWGVLRGGSWANAAPAELRASYRNVVDRTERDVIYGFRCVLVPEPAR